MADKNKIKALLERLNSLESPQKDIGDFADQIVSNKMKGFTDEIRNDSTLKLLDGINQKLEQFRTDFNLSPVDDAIAGITDDISIVKKSLNDGFTQQTNDFNTKISGIEKTIATLEKQSLNAKTDTFSKAVDGLRTQLATVGVSRSTDKEMLTKQITKISADLDNKLKALDDKADAKQLEQAKKEITQNVSASLLQLRTDFTNQLSHHGGGQANRNIVFSSSVLSRYTDLNILGASYVNNDKTKQADVTLPSGGGGGTPSIGGGITGGTAGSIIFVNPTGTLAQDNNNFYIQDSATTPQQLASNTNVAVSVNTNGDFSGTNALNAYSQIDAYLPNSLQGTLTTDGAVSGFTVSTSRGTGQTPVQSQTGDLVGMFSGWSAQGASAPTYVPVAATVISTIGSSTNNLGGQLDFYTKADGGSLVNNMSIKNDGTVSIQPVSILSSGVANILAIVPTINQSGSGGSRSLMIYPFLQAVGSTNLLISAGTASSSGGGGVLTQVFSLSTGGQMAVGSGTSRSGVFNIGGNLTAGAWGTSGINFNTQTATYSDNTSAVGTVSNNMVNSFATSTLTTPTNAVTYTNAATVYIAGAPTAGTNVTLTNPYALYVANGLSQFQQGSFLGSLIASSGINANGFIITGNFSKTPTTTTGIALSLAGGYNNTDSGTAVSGTVANVSNAYMQATTLNAANTGVVYTVANTLYIAGAPAAGTNVTIGTPWALNVAAGNSNFGGTIQTSSNFFASGRISSGANTNAAAIGAYAGITVGVNYGTAGFGLQIAPGTYDSTTSSGTISTSGINTFGIPTLTASSATTLTNSATVYIDGAPVASTNITQTNAWAVYAPNGASQFNDIRLGKSGTAVIDTQSGGTLTLGSFSTSTTMWNGNISVASSGNIAGSVSTAGLLFGGAANIQTRAAINGITSTALTASTSYAGFIVGKSPVTMAATGTVAWLANGVVNTLGTVTNASAITVTNTASLFVGAASAAGTNNYTAYFDTGTVAFNGLIQTTLTTQQLALNYDATHTAAFTVDSSGNLTIKPTGQINLATANRTFSIVDAASTSGFYQFNSGSGTASALGTTVNGTWNASSGTNTIFAINPTISQTSTAGYTALLINPTESTTGSGTKLLVDFQIGGSSKTSINNIGTISNYKTVATTGWGIPAIYGYARPAAGQTAAVTLSTYTVGAADGTFLVSANILVTTSTLHTFTVTCSYTDEGNTARVVTLQFSNLAGTFVTTIANAAGAVPYEGVPLHIRCKASTSITVATAAGGTYTTVVYNGEGSIVQLA